MLKAACDLTDRDCIGVKAATLGIPGNGYFRLPVIAVDYLGGDRVRVRTPNKPIECTGSTMFAIVEPLEMDTNDRAPQFPVKSIRKGRTIE